MIWRKLMTVCSKLYLQILECIVLENPLLPDLRKPNSFKSFSGCLSKGSIKTDFSKPQ